MPTSVLLLLLLLLVLQCHSVPGVASSFKFTRSASSRSALRRPKQ
jgi:hypothetical protein